MPSRKQLIRRAEDAERRATEYEQIAATIQEHAVYTRNEDGQCHQAVIDRETKQFIFARPYWMYHGDRTHRITKQKMREQGYYFHHNGTAVTGYYPGDVVLAEHRQSSAELRQQAADLRAQAAATPANTPPDPTTQCTLWLTMYYITKDNPEGLPGDIRPEQSLRISFNKAIECAKTTEDFDSLAEIADAHGERLILGRANGMYTVDGYVNNYVVFPVGEAWAFGDSIENAMLDSYRTVGDAIMAALEWDLEDLATRSIDEEQLTIPPVDWIRTGF